jgi:hypothetical protein
MHFIGLENQQKAAQFGNIFSWVLCQACVRDTYNFLLCFSWMHISRQVMVAVSAS